MDLQRASAERWRDDKEILSMLQTRLQDACAARAAITERLRDEFGMSQTGAYRWDDSTQTLIEET